MFPTGYKQIPVFSDTNNGYRFKHMFNDSYVDREALLIKLFCLMQTIYAQHIT